MYTDFNPLKRANFWELFKILFVGHTKRQARFSGIISRNTSFVNLCVELLNINIDNPVAIVTMAYHLIYFSQISNDKIDRIALDFWNLLTHFIMIMTMTLPKLHIS